MLVPYQFNCCCFYYSLKLGRVIPLVWFPSLVTALAIQGLSWFHTKFRTFCSCLCENATGICREVALALGHMETLTTAALPVPLPVCLLQFSFSEVLRVFTPDLLLPCLSLPLCSRHSTGFAAAVNRIVLFPLQMFLSVQK